MAGKTFAQEFEEAVKRLDSDSKQAETARVHQETVRDGQHAFRNVGLRKPDPWRNKTDLTI